MRFVACLLAATILALPVAARPLSEAEAAALAKAIDNFRRVTETKNAEKIVETVPPRVLNVVAGAGGIEAADVKSTLVAQTKAILKDSKISGFVTAPGPFEANDAVLADGTQVVWVVVPTQFVAEGGGKKTQNNQPLLAIEETGKWYFSRIDGPQQQQLVGLAYPFIAGAELPIATATPLN